MTYLFPSEAWVQAFKDKLNSDENYARIARKWEGDFVFQIEADGPLDETCLFYLDLWHGTCRKAFIIEEGQLEELDPAYVLVAPYGNFIRVLSGSLDPMQAMITRKLKVKGSMAYMMRNVPTVMDFVRCAQEIDSEILK
jgi:putative sterol carrier protein